MAARLACYDQAIAMANAGKVSAEIAATVGVNVGYVSRLLSRLRRQGLVPPLDGRKPRCVEPFDQATPEYRCWVQIKSRCRNPKTPNFHCYGGRGIRVCQRWLDSFANFLADMGNRPSDGHSIERIDNDGNYEPSNCKWATQAEQDRNKRTNVFIEFQGMKLTITEWAARLGMCQKTISLRIKRGWSPERALTAPSMSRQDRGRLSWEIRRNREESLIQGGASR